MILFVQPHSSIISKKHVADLQPIPVNSAIDKNNGHSTTTFYRCPLCPVKTAYYNLLASKCIDHINSNKHLGLAVRHHQWYICKCEEAGCSGVREHEAVHSSSSTGSSNSGGSIKLVHYHCPHCAGTFMKRNDLKGHLNSCCLLLSLGNRHLASEGDSEQINSLTDKLVSVSPAAHYNVLYLVSSPSSSSTSKPVLRCVNSTAAAASTGVSQPPPPPAKRLITLDSSTTPLAPATKIIKLVHTNELLGRSSSEAADGNLSLVDFQQLQQTLGIDSTSATTAPSVDEQSHISGPSTHQIVNLASSNHATSNKSPEPESTGSFKTHGQKVFSMSQHNYNQTCHSHHHHHHADFSAPTSSSSCHKSSTSLYNSGLPAHIVQNYSILANEIIAPLDSSPSSSSHHQYGSGSGKFTEATSTAYDDIDYSSVLKQWTNAANQAVEAAAAAAVASKKTPGKLIKRTTLTPAINSSSSASQQSTGLSSGQPPLKSQRDTATCQFCGRFMLKKNIPTHIRRAHTPKEELVCLNEEQCIFTLQHLKPGQRRKRSARAYDYSLMTAKVSIDDDPCDSIENKFIMFGEEILNTDLVQLADRIKYGVSQIPVSTLSALVEILGKIENSNNQEDICEKAKELKNQICYFLASGEEFKYKLRQVGDEITTKKNQVNALRVELKEIMSKKAQLERRIQPLVCDLQRLEDHHGNLIESIYSVDMFDYSLNNSSSNNASSTSKYDDDVEEEDEEEEEEEEEEDQQENSNTNDEENC